MKCFGWPVATMAAGKLAYEEGDSSNEKKTSAGKWSGI